MKRWFGRRDRAAHPVVVVSGLPRSGTSMMMRMLAAGGIDPLTDGLREADTDNPRGYYELERVKGLSSGDVDWLSEAPGKAVKVIATLLYELPAGYEYRVIFMRRRMSEILASQRRMLVNRGEDPDSVSDEEMARVFRGHLARLETWIADRSDVEVLDVDYNELVDGQVDDTVARIADFLARPLDVDAMRQVVDQSLYRRRH